jgi:uncharacterized protein
MRRELFVGISSKAASRLIWSPAARAQHGRKRRSNTGQMTRCAIMAVGLMGTELPGAAIAGPFEDAAAAHRKGDYSAAMRIIQPLAEQGNAVAQSIVGAMYRDGEGVPPNYAEALRWFRRAAEQGNDNAQTNLAFMYINGEGVPQNYDEALRWFRKAAEQGNDKAQLLLGTMYYNAEGVQQNYAEALKWFRKAAEQNNDKAQGMLGIMYAVGDGVKQNYVLGHMWSNISVSSLPPGKFRDEAVKYRDLVASKMTPAQLTQAQTMAARCLRSNFRDCDSPQAADQKDKAAPLHRTPGQAPPSNSAVTPSQMRQPQSR